MTAIQKSLMLGIGIAALLGAAFYFLVFQKQTSHNGVETAATSTPSMGSSTSLGSGVSLKTPEGTEVKVIQADDPSFTPPPLNRPITIATSIAPDTAQVIRSAMEELGAKLKVEPTRVDLWLNLGTYRFIAGDLEGARIAWEFVANAGPVSINYVAYGNLGDLYAHYLHDYAQGEANYKKAIAIKPTNIDYYRNLYELYRDVYKTDTTAARDILQLGLKNNPNNADLTLLLSAYNKTHVQ